MLALTRSIYFAWNKPRLTKEVSFHAEFGRARRALIRLAEQPPYTLFSLYTAAALRNKKRELTLLYPADAGILLEPFRGLFEEKIELAETPRYGSKAFQSLKEKPAFDLFVDLDPNPLPELAILSAAKLRITYNNNNLFPFFNVLFNLSNAADLRHRAVLMVRSLVGEKKIEDALPKPQLNPRKAMSWLKDHALNSAKKPHYLVSSIPLSFKNVQRVEILPPESWQNEEPDVKVSLFAQATAYVGGLDRGFELAYLLGIPSIILIDQKVLKCVLPPSHLVKTIVDTKTPLSPETVERAITNLLL